jgi:rRNA maturation RNase YbeY
MIHFFEEDIRVPLDNKRALKFWLQSVAKQEGKRMGELNYVFCSDQYLLEMNQQYLNHNTLTDIITFDQSDDAKKVEGDIYISYERVIENGKILQSETTELYRVIVHGLLHLLGFKDKKEEEQKLMRSKEDYYIKQLILD